MINKGYELQLTKNILVCPKCDSWKSDNYTESNKEKKQRTDVK